MGSVVYHYSSMTIIPPLATVGPVRHAAAWEALYEGDKPEPQCVPLVPTPLTAPTVTVEISSDARLSWALTGCNIYKPEMTELLSEALLAGTPASNPD
jgi:hypothetical protein